MVRGDRLCVGPTWDVLICIYINVSMRLLGLEVLSLLRLGEVWFLLDCPYFFHVICVRDAKVPLSRSTGRKSPLTISSKSS